MKRSRVWTGLASVFSFFLVVAILGMNCMMVYSTSINGALGIRTSRVENPEGTDAAQTTYFESEYGELNAENLQKLIADTYDHAVAEQEEGSVLLRNENGALPLASGERSVTLFGHAVAQPLYKAHSAGSNGYTGEYNIDLYTALTSAGFDINDTLYDAYVASSTSRSTGVAAFGQEPTAYSMGEESISFYTDAIRASWDNEYNDVAIVMLSREAGEGSDLHVRTPDGGVSQLALQQDEKDMLDMIRDSGKFGKTIVLLNSGWAMELGWLEEYAIDACLWIGLPGQRGFEGVANLLTGAANPSGKLVDTYAVDSLSAPATVYAVGNSMRWGNADEIVAATGGFDEENVGYYTIQAESIYVGYKYYETRYEDVILGQGNADSAPGSTAGGNWNYNAEVTFPFGYGLSYSSFTQTLDKVDVGEDTATATVTVTNTGSTAGKNVVQVYAQTPYGDYEKTNKVEKAAIQLLDFGKTGLLQPGESETITIECDKYLLASYDYTKEKGYILSEGDYYLAIGDDAHDALNNVLAAKGATGMVDVLGNETEGNAENAYAWQESFDADKYNLSQYTGAEVTNQFDDADINYWLEDTITYLSRNDWQATYPAEAIQLSATEDMIEMLKGYYYEKPADAPSVSSYTQGDNQGIPLAAMIGLDYDDPMWETYLNQFTIEELAINLADGFGTAEIPSVGKPAVIVGDGPDGIGGTSTFDAAQYGDGRDNTAFPCQMVLTSTFNKELMERRGALMGEEAMYLGMAQVWMPGGNLHRTPFSGRNFEYYSEDATLSYLSMIEEAQAIESKGVHAGPKHLTGNDQELYRQGISVFFTEQAFREGSLRSFEGALTTGGAQTVMQGFNRLGLVWCSTSEALCTNIVVNEWGFIGQQETDAIAVQSGYKADFLTCLAVGTDTFCLDFSGASTAAVVAHINSTDDGYLLGKLRESVHDYLYTVANSSVMNGFSTDSTVVKVTPWWQPVMYVAIAVFAVLFLLSIIMLLRSARGKKIAIEEEKK